MNTTYASGDLMEDTITQPVVPVTISFTHAAAAAFEESYGSCGANLSEQVAGLLTAEVAALAEIKWFRSLRAGLRMDDGREGAGTTHPQTPDEQLRIIVLTLYDDLVRVARGEAAQLTETKLEQLLSTATKIATEQQTALTLTGAEQEIADAHASAWRAHLAQLDKHQLLDLVHEHMGNENRVVLGIISQVADDQDIRALAGGPVCGYIYGDLLARAHDAAARWRRLDREMHTIGREVVAVDHVALVPPETRSAPRCSPRSTEGTEPPLPSDVDVREALTTQALIPVTLNLSPGDVALLDEICRDAGLNHSDMVSGLLAAERGAQEQRVWSRRHRTDLASEAGRFTEDHDHAP